MGDIEDLRHIDFSSKEGQWELTAKENFRLLMEARDKIEDLEEKLKYEQRESAAVAEMAERIKDLEEIVNETYGLMMDGWMSWSLITKDDMHNLGKKCQDLLGIEAGDGTPF